MTIMVCIVIAALSITILQFKYFQIYKKLISRFTIFSIAGWVIALIVYGVITGSSQPSFKDLKEDYPIYIIVIVIALTIQFIIKRNDDSLKRKRD
ncbi:hypothetical protein H8B09_29840 [Paenibacillus sp. PR3]|uniref:Uncharacterized protein n=1 Tax=Paenibacillus terricola TaxID=2763503 RepID=A0ABR8N447_9BACL|nr:hypothetical protein [Paenibacillus terricola]MBD3922947.1 hypothetical protein [Paenibacillus terricola]